MNPTEMPATSCSKCDRAGQKTHRVHNGERFCSICYARLFKRRLCPSCGNGARLPVWDNNACCLTCVHKGPCVRCSEIGKPVGRITEYGPVCASCAHYFSKPKACGGCGKLTTRLTTVTKGAERVSCCPSCVRQDFATCQDCRRYRLLVAGTDGKMRCKLCSTQGTSLCLTCNGVMPAGKGKECEGCGWDRHFKHRATVYKECFEHELVRERFAEFCDWLKLQMGGHKATLRLKSYVPFFLFLDEHPSKNPTYVALLEHFNAEGLRRMQTPMLWLKERYNIEADEATREEHSDRRRIDELIASVPSSLGATTLSGYQASLMSKYLKGRTTIRSVRLSMRAAKNLLETASVDFKALPTQDSVEKFLIQTPGQKAAVQGFISYLNHSYGLSLRPQVNERAVSRARVQKLEATLLAMYTAKGEGDAFNRQWIKSALMLLHGLPKVNKKSLSYSVLAFKGEPGFNVSFNAKTYWVPAPQAQPDWLHKPS